ncbi:MAG: APC family permease [Oscillospiraceae bacterium]|nr:APC family permease [Oscillospiraceae bacterium]
MNNNTQHLRKSLSLFQIIALAAGGMIAAWMVEIQYWFELSGTGSLLALLLCGVLVLPLCFIYTEMTSMMPYAGGENIWVTNAFGWNTGWLCCWFVLLLYVMAMPTVSYGIASMASYLFSITTLQTKVIATIILIIWFILSNFELKMLARIQSLLFWSTLAVSLIADLIFICSGLFSTTGFSWRFSNLSPWFPAGGAGFAAAVALLIMKFIGFDMIPQLSEETNFPHKDLWKAFVGSLFFTFLIYGTAIVAVGGIVDLDWIAATDIVDPRVADLLNLHWLGVVIVVMGALTCLTTLTGFWASASRTIFGAANQGQLTRRFSKLNAHGQPVLANIVVCILSVFFTAFAPEAWVNYIYTIYGLTAGIVYLLVALSFLRLRRTHPEWNRPYRVPHGIFWGIFSVLFCAYVIYISAITLDLTAWGVMAIYIAIGLCFWGYAKFMQKRNAPGWEMQITSPDTTN